jgi:elongation factor G
MKRYDTPSLRNLALVGHKGAGKTSLAEAMVFTAGATARLGKVDDGTTVAGVDPEERAHGCSVQVSALHAALGAIKLNILDLPGDSSFAGDALNALQVAEIAVLVVSATDGLDAEAMRWWRLTQGRARCIVVNKLGRERTDFATVVAQAQRRWGASVAPVTLPVGEAHGFDRVIDLLNLTCHVGAPKHAAPRVADIPPEAQARALAARHALLEEISANDEALLEKYLDSGDLNEAETLAALRLGVLGGSLTPVFAADATHNLGVLELMSLVCRAFPSPADAQIFPLRAPMNSAPFAGIVFKTTLEQHTGRTSLVRVIAGDLARDQIVEVASRGVQERIGSLALPQGRRFEPVDAVAAGDIVAVPKLKVTQTGDVLVEPHTRCDAALPPLPPPQITYRVLPRHSGDDDKISSGIHRLHEEDPSLRVGHDDLTQELTLAGFGSAHIDVALERLARKYHVHADKALPRVPYRETIVRPVRDVEGKHKKQSGGRGQFGVCSIHLSPLPRGEGYSFIDSIFGGAIPRQYIPAVDKGIREALGRGMLAGYPMVDVCVELVDGKYHDVDSSELAFKIAGSKAVQAAAHAAGVQLLEPVMRVDVEVPEACLGDVIGDISARRGHVLGMASAGEVASVRALVPLAELLHYANDLKAKTAGQGTFSMALERYEPVPAERVGRIIAESPHRPAGNEEA